MSRDNFTKSIFESPVGALTLVATDSALVGLFLRGDEFPTAVLGTSATLEQTKKELSEYFAGNRAAFEMPLAPVGTEFQREVWAALQTIPFGMTCSYLDIAKRIKRPKAVRAVGAANGKNPISIIIPCHRVIGTNGNLIGYGGGLPRKRWLLAHEGAELDLRAPVEPAAVSAQ